GGESVPSVTRLLLAGSQAQSAEGETRPAVSLSPGDSLVWPVSAGPERRLRLAYCWKASSNTKVSGSLQLTLFPPDAESSPIHMESLRLKEPLHSGRVWRTAELFIPQTRRPASLRLHFRQRPGPGFSPALLLAQPTLSPRFARSPRVVILFDIDTLRRDHLSLYGYNLPTTPHIDSFFSDGLISENCVSNSEWTLPSHATLFTSTLPNRHGTGDYNASLPDSLPTLAESLAQAGYRTLAVTGGGYVDPVFGFARGFDMYCVTDANVDAEVRAALSWIDVYREEPIFLFFHTFQVHNYAPTRRAALELVGSLEELGPNWNRSTRELWGKGYLPEDMKRWVGNRYDAALRVVDDSFRQLMSGLKDRGLLESTGVVVTSDHGEEILDRRGPTGGFLGLGHTHPFLYEEYLAVPMLLKFPWLKVPPERVTENVSLVDLAPTLLDAVGVSRPAAFQGASFLSRTSSGRRRDRIIVSEASRYDSLAVRRGFYKMIVRPGYSISSWEDGTAFGTLASEECFNLEEDSAEKSPLPCVHQAWARDLRAHAEEYVRNEFPGSLVIRFPASATPGASRYYGLRVRGRDSAPSVLSFGMDPGDKPWSQRDRVAGQFRVGSAPVWVAVRPERPGGAIEVETLGLSSFHVPGRREPVQSGTFQWADLLIRGTLPINEGVLAFSTEPAPLISSAQGKTPPLSVIARLRSLGYISAGEWVPREVTAEELNPAAKPLPPLELPEGSVRIRSQTDLPGRPIPAIRRLHPNQARIGEIFQRQPSGDAAIAITGSGFVRGDTIFWNGRLLRTMFGSDTLLAAGVPPDLLTKPGDIQITVRNPTDPAHIEPQATFKLLPADARDPK
ncbi:MAG: sulfatase, partial [Thermoanaerobaculia bacterium]